jgi:hypothetical protein
MTGPVGTLPNAPVSAARSALNVAIFLAAVATVCGLIDGFLPFPKVDGVYQKWAHFRTNKDRYDALFVGSSRIYRQIIPEQFDEQVNAATGESIHSFNFGMDGMWPPESFFVLRELLSLEPKRLRWVFIEVMEVATGLDDSIFTPRRTAYWHDWEHTLMAMEAVSEQSASVTEKWRLNAEHGLVFVRRSMNQGRLARRLGAAFGADPGNSDQWSRGEWMDAEGFAGRDTPFEGWKLDQYRKFVEKAKTVPPPRVPISRALRQSIERIVSEVRAMGAEPILIISPSLVPSDNFSELPADVAVWSFRGPNDFPALYDPKNRFDTGHLNSAGAVVYTELLASRFASHIAKVK